jgi:outer membrane protein
VVVKTLVAIAAGLAVLGSSPAAIPCAAPAAADTLVLSLDESVRLALEHNARVRVGREKIAEASSGVDEARTAFFPQLAGSAGYTRLDTAPYIPGEIFGRIFSGSGLFPPLAVPERIPTGLVDNYAATIALTQPLYAAGRLRRSYDVAKLARRTAVADLDLVSCETAFEASQAYLACMRAALVEEIARETVRQLEAHVTDIEARFDEGLAATNDVLKTKVYHSDARLSLMRAQHALRLASRNLCEVIGAPLDTEIRIAMKVDSVSAPAVDLGTAVERAVARRAELRSTDCRKLMARKEVEIERSGYLPTLSFFADLSYLRPNREYEPDFYSAWRLGLVARMNVFDWGGAVYRSREAASRLRQIEIAEDGLRDDVTLDVTRTRLTVIDAWSAIEVAREKLAQAEENWRVTSERFAEGLATNTDLLDAEVLLTGAKTSMETMLVDYLLAEADLERAMGGPEN